MPVGDSFNSSKSLYGKTAVSAQTAIVKIPTTERRTITKIFQYIDSLPRSIVDPITF